jgi:hypothetical protein
MEEEGLKNDSLLRVLKITIVGNKAKLTFSKFGLQFPVKMNYDMTKNFMIYVLQSIFSGT